MLIPHLNLPSISPKGTPKPLMSTPDLQELAYKESSFPLGLSARTFFSTSSPAIKRIPEGPTYLIMLYEIRTGAASLTSLELPQLLHSALMMLIRF